MFDEYIIKSKETTHNEQDQMIESSSFEHYTVLNTFDNNKINQSVETENFEFATAAALLELSNHSRKISTGSLMLDNILNGGIESKSITEFYGVFASGKTQLCLQLAVNAVIMDGEISGYSIYIDTEGSFRPERVVDICHGMNIDHNQVLNHILVARAHTTDIQMQLINEVSNMAKQKTINLVIIDSLTSNFRSEFIGKSSLMERQQKLNRHMQELLQLSEKLSIPLAITNQVLASVDLFNSEIIPVGGNIVAHGSTHRIHLSKIKSKSTLRKAELISSPSLPNSEASFQIVKRGIIDLDQIY